MKTIFINVTRNDYYNNSIARLMLGGDRRSNLSNSDLFLQLFHMF